MWLCGKGGGYYVVLGPQDAPRVLTCILLFRRGHTRGLFTLSTRHGGRGGEEMGQSPSDSFVERRKRQERCERGERGLRSRIKRKSSSTSNASNPVGTRANDDGGSAGEFSASLEEMEGKPPAKFLPKEQSEDGAGVEEENGAGRTPEEGEPRTELAPVEAEPAAGPMSPSEDGENAPGREPRLSYDAFDVLPTDFPAAVVDEIVADEVQQCYPSADDAIIEGEHGGASPRASQLNSASISKSSPEPYGDDSPSQKYSWRRSVESSVEETVESNVGVVEEGVVEKGVVEAAVVEAAVLGDGVVEDGVVEEGAVVEEGVVVEAEGETPEGATSPEGEQTRPEGETGEQTPEGQDAETTPEGEDHRQDSVEQEEDDADQEEDHRDEDERMRFPHELVHELVHEWEEAEEEDAAEEEIPGEEEDAAEEEIQPVEQEKPEWNLRPRVGSSGRNSEDW